jgi:hypothetical protein
MEVSHQALSNLVLNSALTSLSVENNSIDDQGAEILATIPNLKKLNVANNVIGNRGAIALAGNKTLISLDVGSNKIGKEGIEALIQNEDFTHFDMSSNLKGEDEYTLSKKMLDGRLERVKRHNRLGTLLPLIFSGKDLTGDDLVTLPDELEKIILDYCKPPRFILQNI